ncbi:MAG: thioredoxin family protein [Sphingobacteriaceae bacterium]|nr:thioredoxin family protein [Sphingobacteriaceae bacterium]
MNYIKVLGPDCPKCQATYDNVIQALEDTGTIATVEKIQDLKELMRYDILTTPVLIINGVIVIKGRVARTDEIKQLLNA